MVGIKLMNPFSRRSRSATEDPRKHKNNNRSNNNEPLKRVSNSIVGVGHSFSYKVTEEDTLTDPSHNATNKSFTSAFASTYKKLSFHVSPSRTATSDDEFEADMDGVYPNGTIVATKYGTAIVLEYRPDDKIYVCKTFWHATAYFNPETIVREVVCMIGDRVKTKWGMATVESYYLNDDMYGIALDWRWDDDHVWRMKATTKMFELIEKNPKSRAQITKELMQKTASVGYSSLRSSTSNGYNTLVNKMASMSNTLPSLVSSPRLEEMTKPATKPVWTPYGEGRVIGHRDSDGMAKVKLRSGAIVFLMATSLESLPYGTSDPISTIYGDGYVSSYRHSDTMYTLSIGTPGVDFFTRDIHSIVKPSAPKETGVSSIFKSFPKVPAKFSTPKMFQSLPSVPLKRDKFAIGDHLKCQFGSATITDYRPNDDVYVCVLNTMVGAPPVMYIASGQMDTVFPESLNPTALGSLLQMTYHATKTLQTSTVQSANVLQKTVKDKWESSQKKRNKYSIDERVLCGAFGSGFVLNFRSDEHSFIYQVKLRKMAIMGYFQESSIRPFPYERATHVLVGEKHISVPMEAYQSQYKTSRSDIIKNSIAVGRHVAIQ
ncbi:hypothetical protein THRCLA_11454, partial [Thraustotheca clavata]